jgi:hypothetical protein
LLLYSTLEHGGAFVEGPTLGDGYAIKLKSTIPDWSQSHEQAPAQLEEVP